MSLARRICAAAALLLIAALPAHAQVGRLQGRITDQDGKPLEGVAVKLTMPSGDLHKSLTTNAKGKWAVLGLEAGLWNIDFQLKGYVPRKISVRVGGFVKPIDIKLERSGPPPEFRQALEAGDAAFTAKSYGEARAQYEKAISLAEQNKLDLKTDSLVTIYKQIAFCYKEEGNTAKEQEYLQKILDADPANNEAKALLAMTAIEAGDLERGTKLLDDLEGVVKNPDVFYNVGVQFLNRDQRDEAIKYFTKAVTVDPGYVDGYFQRGMVYYGLQKLDEAKADFEKVVELKPDGPQATTARKVLDSMKQGAPKP